MADNSLCDNCLYAGSCADSDKGLSFAHHTICWKYVDQCNFTRPTDGQVVPDTLHGWRYEERPTGMWKIGGKTTHYHYCSICGKDGDIQDNFCRNCGAKMEAEND